MKKLIAPIIVAVIIVIYFVFILTITVLQSMPIPGKILAVIIPLALIGIIIFVLIERIKEIRSGEYDDLSKY
ncbi:MAG: hypothetical protein GX994_05665 [Firmicutes bacterium]|nr:hypothetical protein [Bacillota bacterium]